MVASALLTVAANLLLRAGVEGAGVAPGLADLPATLWRLARQPLFDLGFLLYGLAALLWFRVIASEPLSTAYPLLVSLTFVLVTLGAVVFYREPVSLAKMAGLAVILVGILIVSRS